MLRVVGEQCPPEREQLLHTLVGDPVMDDSMLAAGVHEIRTSAGRRGGSTPWLRDAEPVNELSHRELVLSVEKLEDAEARRIAEGAEVLGHEVGRCGNLGKAKWSHRCHIMIRPDTTLDGRLVGLLRLDDAERALGRG